MGGPVEASESQVLDRRTIRRWLPRVGVTLALLVVTPTCAVEAAYRIELLNVPRPVRPRRELAKMAAEALSLDLTGSPVAEIRPIWPWHVAGFLAVAFGNEFFPLGSRTSQQTLKSSSLQRARAVSTAQYSRTVPPTRSSRRASGNSAATPAGLPTPNGRSGTPTTRHPGSKPCPASARAIST